QPESSERGQNAISKTENRQNGEADGEIDQARKSAGDGENKTREIDFGDKPLVFDYHVGGGRQREGKVSPRDERGEVEDRIGQAVGRKLGEAAEEQREDQHVEHGLQNDPQDTDGSLFVSDLNVAPHEKVKELAISPDFAEAKLEEATRRLDANGGWG